MSSMQLVKDQEGQSYIPPSQRPDGTWRKPIRVKDGYVPQDEQPVYVSKGRQTTSQDRPQYPVGMSAADVGKGSSSSGFSVGYFDIGNYTPTTAIPGLNFVESSSAGDGTKAKSKKKKGQQQEGTTTLSTSITGATSTNASSKPGNEPASKPQQPPQAVDPAKRLRNLRKRLKEIEDLEKKIMAGDLKNPEKEQLEKLKRKEEVLDEIDDLEKLVSKLSVS